MKAQRGRGVTERIALVRRVLDAIRVYRQQCPQYSVFEPVDESAELGQAVAALVATYAPASALPEAGAKLWHGLVRSSSIPDREDYFQVFDDLDAFERWVIAYYDLPQVGIAETKKQRATKRLLTRGGELKGSPQTVLDQVIASPGLMGRAISNSTGLGYDAVRKILADLTHLGLIENTGDGYVARS